VQSWFFPDLISVVPFEIFLSAFSLNKVVRFARIGKITKLIRMARVVRLVKIEKLKTSLVKNMKDVVMISMGTERLIFILLMFLMLVHVISCVW
jgi:hypothetical protein